MSDTLRVFIVDDEAPARARMKARLADIAAEVPNQLGGEAAMGDEDETDHVNSAGGAGAVGPGPKRGGIFLMCTCEGKREATRLLKREVG